ncbi:hypothetical protein, partial [Acetivibrio sp. MSJd-27]|uniref:hypothetical protein n=1 Tax=Acetivibrio sp. MSJd-27 TaxID=2841523 RepID=UPI001C10EF36
MKRIVVFFTTLITLFLGTIVVSNAATTSEATENLLKKNAYFEIYGNKQTAPMSVSEAGTESINTISNSLNYTATDLTLEGKNGFDVSIKRDYETLSPVSYTSNVKDVITIGLNNVNPTKSFSYNYVVKYYLDNDVSKPYYILYETLSEIKRFENGDNTLTARHLEDAYKIYPYSTDPTVSKENTDYYYYTGNEFDYFYRVRQVTYNNTASTFTLYRDMNSSPILIRDYVKTEHYKIETLGNHVYHIGSGWTYKLPTMQLVDISIVDYDVPGHPFFQVKTYKYEFIDEEFGQSLTCTTEFTQYPNGTIENVNNSIYTVNIEGKPSYNSQMYTVLNTFSVGEVDQIFDGIVIERYDGVKFYFTDGGMLQKKTDRFGNEIIYNFTGNPSSSNSFSCKLLSITDTYGRVISFAEEGNVKTISVDGVEMVRYITEKQNDASVDPQNKYVVDGTATLTVQKGEPGASGNTIKYKHTLEQSRWKLTADGTGISSKYGGIFVTDHYLLDEIELSTGGKINYRYNCETATSRDFLTKEVFRMSEKWESDPGQTEIKQNYNTYEWDKDSYSQPISITSNANVTVKDNYNRKNQLTKKTTTYSDGKKVVQDYTYSDTNPEGVSLISELYEVTTISGKSITKTTNKTYNKYHQPTSVAENDRQTLTTYNDYGLPIEQKQKQSDGVYVGTKNTYSEDGKKVIKTESFKQTGDTYEYFETTDFEYNQYGEVTKTTAYNEPQVNVVTDIAYNYAPEEEGILYTKTTTVNDVEHVEGQTSVSTHEKYDKMGNLVYQKDGNNNVIAITYDKLGRPLVQTNPDGTTNQFSYDSVSNEIILTNQNNVKQKIKYDKLGREHAIYMEEPGQGYQKMKQTDYDLFSRPIKISLYAESETTPSGVMEYTYYADSSPKSETAKEGSKVLSKKDYAYAINNSLNQTTVEVYSTDTAKTQIVQKTDIHGVIKEQQAIFDGKTYTQSFTHDTLGNVLTTTDFRANDENYTNKAVQKNTYDHANRVTKQEVLKDDGTYMESTVTYDKLGRAVSATDFNGNTVTTAYNKLNKETEVVTPMEENVT